MTPAQPVLCCSQSYGVSESAAVNEPRANGKSGSWLSVIKGKLGNLAFCRADWLRQCWVEYR